MSKPSMRGWRPPSGTRKTVVLFLCIGATAAPAAAQCPDGTPPPCSAPVRRAARRPPPDAANRRRSFLVLPFRNLSRVTEQNWLVEGSPVLLADALSKRTEITVVPDERLYPALRRNGLTPGDVMDLARVRRVAEETGGWTAVTGDVLLFGDRVRVTARAFDVVSAAELMRATEEAGPGEDVRAVYQRLGARMVRAVGLDSASGPLAAGPAPDTGATRSIDAYRAYVQGLVHVNRSEYRRARDAFQTAVRLDSTYAQSWRRLAETELSIDPRSIVDPNAALYRDMRRAVALADRLPPRQREIVLAIDAFLGARFGDARDRLSRLVAQDSNDVDAIEWMANLEGFDPVLVNVAGGDERPRGSLNAMVRLAKRALAIDPARHQLYGSLVQAYLMVGGGAPGVVFGYRRTATSLPALVAGGGPDRTFVPLLRDTIELLTPEAFVATPPDSAAAARRRALDIARQWARRWLTAAPNEAEAHLWASRVYAQSDSVASALAELEKADSLGVESGLENVPARRMALLARLERYGAGARIADSLWRAGALSADQITPYSVDGLGWAFTLFVLGGHLDRADEILRRLSTVLAPAGQARRELGGPGLALALLSGQAPQYFVLPGAAHAAVIDTLLAAALRPPDTTLMMRLLPFRIVLALDDTTIAGRHALAGRAVATAQRLAAGDPDFAYQLADAAARDSSARRMAEALPFYRTRRADARRRAFAQAQRFHPGQATVTDTAATFTWLVSDSTPFSWSRLESPIAQPEYQWQVDFDAGGGHYEALAAIERPVIPAPETGSLEQLLGRSQRIAHQVVSPDTTVAHLLLPRVVIRIEPVTGGFRLVVRDTALVGALRRERPAAVRFRFRPCGRESDDAAPRCIDEMVAVQYR